jgi:homocysteine S-methyltransferase
MVNAAERASSEFTIAKKNGKLRRMLTFTDGGIETTLEEQLGQHLQNFAAFPLLDTEDGRVALTEYFREYLELAKQTHQRLSLDTPTWRASADWGQQLGYDSDALHRVNRDAVRFVRDLAQSVAPNEQIRVNGSVGPRWDDYDPGQRMSVAEATAYHLAQVRALKAGQVDRVTSVTTVDAAEGAGVVLAAMHEGVPAVVSFLIEPGGKLADGSTLDEAIQSVDAVTKSYADGYMINCAHPAEVQTTVASTQRKDRILGFRLNAAREDDTGERDTPEAFAEGTAKLRESAQDACIFGGCCGTDASHIRALTRLLTAEN